MKPLLALILAVTAAGLATWMLVICNRLIRICEHMQEILRPFTPKPAAQTGEKP